MPPKYLILILSSSSNLKRTPVIIHLILSMSILSPNPHILHANIQHHSHVAGYGSASIFPESRRFGFDRSQKKILKSGTATCASFWPELFRPEAIEMEPIRDCEQFDHILDQAKELSQPVLVDWMAAWCRKCIYLKPKLEKLAAEYDTKLKFYCVDVNNVPQALVKRGNISKMPTIQIWKDGELKAEVIGGHKAWLVIEEVREMINQYV